MDAGNFQRVNSTLCCRNHIPLQDTGNASSRDRYYRPSICHPFGNHLLPTHFEIRLDTVGIKRRTKLHDIEENREDSSFSSSRRYRIRSRDRLSFVELRRERRVHLRRGGAVGGEGRRGRFEDRVTGRIVYSPRLVKATNCSLRARLLRFAANHCAFALARTR